jgi:signal transduction histidine kinase/CheY-like chemotaxis protein
MHLLQRCGLKGQAVGLCVLLVLGAVVATSTALIWQYYHDSRNRVTAHALIHTRTIAYSAEPAVLLNDIKTLEHVTQAAASDVNVCQVTILDPQGKPLANLQRPHVHNETVEVLEPCHTDPGQVHRTSARLEWAANHLLVVAPIWRQTEVIDLGIASEDTSEVRRTQGADAPIAYVAITYSLDPLHKELRSGFIRSAITCLIVITAGVSLTIVMVQQLLNPVRNLVRTATLIARGDLTQQASEQAVGEIGILARAFNYMAASLRQYTENLEEQVQRRTIELEKTNQELLRAKVQAETSSQAKSQFLANMSHEIRTPMTAILGYSDMLFDSEITPDERQECIQTIHRNGEHLLSIINDILDISKIEADRMVVEHIDCSVESIIEEVSSIIRSRALEKGLFFDVEYDGAIPATIRSDPTRLRQILINLLGNAVKFTETGGVKLIGRYLEGKDSSLQFDVVDTGIGMTPDEVRNLFLPFTQGDVSMTRKFGGTGLGLAISRRIAQLMGGEVLVLTTQPGKGTTFRLTIPVACPEGSVAPAGTAAADEEVADASNSAVPSSSPLACRLLLAEDGPDNQRLISRLLQKAGADVTVVENGKLALQEVMNAWQQDGRPYDIILMDMQMPVMDGYLAVHLLRKKGYTGPIIALTAHAMATDREKCISAGCTDYLSKPIKRTMLIEMIRKHLQPIMAA